MNPDRRKALGTGAFAGVACAACCAPPIIAALGLTLGLAAVAGVVAGFAVAVAVVILGVTAIAARRQRARRAPVTGDSPVSVPAPTRRPET
jgi:nitrate/nitrite transporter NarK